MSELSLALSEIARSLLLSELSELFEASLLSELLVLSELLLPESATPPTSKLLLLSELSIVAVEVSLAAAEPLSTSAAHAKLAAELSIRVILTASMFLLKDFIFFTPLKIIL